MKVKLMDIVVDPTIQVREVESFTVSQYADSMRSGSIFPPIILEEKTNRLICGNHRYCSYKTVFDPDYEIEVEFKKFKNEAEIIRFAAVDNAHHGRPLDTWDKKRIAIRLSGYGDNAESIAKLLSVSVDKIKSWADMTVVIIGKKSKPERKPLKRGFENMAGKEVTQEQYDQHEKKDYGVPAKIIAAQLTRIIVNNWIDKKDEKTMENLRLLKDALNKFI